MCSIVKCSGKKSNNIHKSHSKILYQVPSGVFVESTDEDEATASVVGQTGGRLLRGDKILSVDGKQTESRSYEEILHQGMIPAVIISALSPNF
jgi:hypothetical protein